MIAFGSESSELLLIIKLFILGMVPFLIAGGTCFIKFTVVFSLLKNAIGIQQIPTNLTTNAIALMMTLFVMYPVYDNVFTYIKDNEVILDDSKSVDGFLVNGLASYKNYLIKYSDKELVSFFSNLNANRQETTDENFSFISYLPAYALTEIKSAFEIGFYLYLPFVIIDLIVSNILLALGMMMMSPVTISLPIKLILFVAIDGWSRVSQGLILQYFQ
ncbi:MAG: EscR/YscR/HrcR family type III secretion system export apparatus protein [Vibrio sp.]|uniref:EscR/YscR/HrcR family type III secretion system export apparatus protein n=1 Tax=Vibrio TaxID=662 RepID=UPI00140AF6C7|nr:MULTISPECIES: EscR/YscR/HrcR family type III secretion system export apparatus protein [unclassified Vibrio]QIL85669.1 EscR/YscR/HrcR family type III secretion system export apparatus protein [Vibrio sp. HDW18]